ncbi:hypothetical protein LOTGIDRAFT_106561 [Lottia gigantea]|uniref:Uncharacterized protein n=1 Tax=Lottia gigantea TaxID=225164 RepID=V4BL03_LOTGI|nr:hypothetical protein LOTGIDRAFT_106561 [Lottia gigantea]ESO89269.1 hypothetical protein LOTGIDRAFT_106561 [Lottia gigantea]
MDAYEQAVPEYTWTNLILLGVFISIAVVYTRKLIKNQATGLKYPPVYEGWLPWIGCAMEFGKQPLEFIHKKQQDLGPVFTCKIAGENMTFLTDPQDLHAFFQSPCLDFQKAVQTSVQNVASISKESFFKYHSNIHDLVKGKLASSQLAAMSDKLYTEFKEQLDTLPSQGTEDLNKLVRYLMYKPTLNCLFGRNSLPVNNEVNKNCFEHFVKFDDQFEYGAKLPAFLLKAWSSSREYLLKIFCSLVNDKKESSHQTNNDKTLFESLLDTIDDQSSPNFCLLLMWASLANAIPMTFWTLAYILTHEDVYKKVCDEINNTIPDNILYILIVFNIDINKMVYIKSCILETIRLRSPGVIPRYVVQPFQIGKYTVPVGHRIFASVFWAHRNPDCFQDPNRFNPERWDTKDIERNVFPKYFFPFGGGRYQCPGRWFGLMEIQIFLVMFLKKFKFEVFDSLPKPSYLHIVGTQQPATSFSVQYQHVS